MKVCLNFHGLGEPDSRIPDAERRFWLSEDQFERVLDAVCRMNREQVGITFDDGNASDVLIALPALRQRGLRGSFFVVSGRIGQPGYLSADQIRLLTGEDMLVGSHGARHERWTEMSDDALRDDISSSCIRLEEITGFAPSMAAVPFGSYDARVLRALRKQRFERIYTSDPGPVVPNSWLVARYSVRADTTIEEVEAILLKQSWTDVARTALRQWRRSRSGSAPSSRDAADVRR